MSVLIGLLLLTDFTTASADLGWYVVNDNVMGGRSEGSFKERDGALSFTGGFMSPPTWIGPLGSLGGGPSGIPKTMSSVGNWIS